MIYLVEAYSPLSKVSKVVDTYLKASEYMKEMESYGYSVSVSPMDLNRQQFGEVCLDAVKNHYEKGVLDA